MPQVIAPPLLGIELGPGANGVGVMRLLAGSGDPNVSATDNSAGIIANSAVGSVYHRLDTVDSTHQFYIKTAFVLNGPGTWTAK